MNRQMKRQQERLATKQEVTYNFTKKQLQEMLNKEITKDRQNTVNRLYAVMGISLHDSEGFGHKRLKRVFERSSKQFECVMDGYVTEAEIMAEVSKYGIIIK